MVENVLRQTSKKTWYRWSLYINLILFFIVALFIYLLVFDCIQVGIDRTLGESGDVWLYVARDIAFIAVSLALIFYQFFRNLFTIMRRSL
jgi:hypothetical protein